MDLVKGTVARLAKGELADESVVLQVGLATAATGLRCISRNTHVGLLFR